MSIIEHIIALLAPHHCLKCGVEGAHLCKGCAQTLPNPASGCYRCKSITAKGVCDACYSKVKIQRMVWATLYSGPAKDILWELKFNRSKEAARTIARVLHCRTPELPTSVIVTFLPTAHSRVRQRGYDQAALIAQEFAKLRGLPYSPLLVRLGSHRQVGSTFEERHIRMKDAFRVKQRNLLPIDANTTVVLIDDVITTGSSMEEAARVLYKTGIDHIWAVAFARAG